jgi:hypothetical protein
VPKPSSPVVVAKDTVECSIHGSSFARCQPSTKIGILQAQVRFKQIDDSMFSSRVYEYFGHVAFLSKGFRQILNGAREILVGPIAWLQQLSADLRIVVYKWLQNNGDKS